MSQFEEEKIFDFKPIPGFVEHFLVRVNNKFDNLGLLRAIGIMINRHKASTCSYAYARYNPKRHIYIGREMLDWIETLDRNNAEFTEEILPTVQAFLNERFGPEKYNVILFDGTEHFKYEPRQFRTRELRPIYEGNPQGKFLVSLLKYKLDGKIEFCGLNNVGRAFGIGIYCNKCKHTYANLKTHDENPCEKVHANKLYDKYILPQSMPELSRISEHSNILNSPNESQTDQQVPNLIQEDGNLIIFEEGTILDPY